MTENKQKRSLRKPGRTLLVKVLDGVFDHEQHNLEGLTNHHFTEKTNSHFLTFDTAPNALNALRFVKKEYDTRVRVKVAHYRVFFTLDGLDDSMDYNTIKTQHRDFVQNSGNTSVLFYKLYRKNNKYLGCGDMTLDSKEGLDYLMSTEGGGKTFTLECGLSGSHYRFRNQNSQEQSQTMGATVSA